MPNPETKDSKDFSDFEKETLEENVVSELKSDVQRYLNKLHRKQMEEIEEKISTIEARCNQEIRETLAKHVKIQLEQHFQKVVLSCKDNISQVLSPFLRRAEEDVESLNSEVCRTNELCQDIQKQYSFRWGRPFAIIMLTTISTGVFVALALILMQTSFLAVFLMNKETREAYTVGLNFIRYKEKLKAQAEKEKMLENMKGKKKLSQR